MHAGGRPGSMHQSITHSVKEREGMGTPWGHITLHSVMHRIAAVVHARLA